jgi:hypothetical protein
MIQRKSMRMRICEVIFLLELGKKEEEEEEEVYCASYA